MSEIEKRNGFCYAAGACFALSAVFWLYHAYIRICDGYPTDSIVFVGVLTISCGLLAASLFAAEPLLGAVGAALGLLACIEDFVACFLYYLECADWCYHPVLQLIIHPALLCLYYMLLMAAALSKQKKVMFGILAAFCAVGYLVMFFLYGSSPSLYGWVAGLLWIVGAVLTSPAYSKMPKHGQPIVSPAKPSRAVGDRIAQLEKLQILLQQGIITQEEFNEKKQHLLAP